MSQFERPAAAIENVADLQVGDHIWDVCGIWPPQRGGEHIVTRAATVFKDHPKFPGEGHTSMGGDIVFDVKWADKNSRPIMNFASDGNMLPGHSHNDNYWFRSEAEAAAAVVHLKSEWEKSGRIAEEIARREMDRIFDYAD